MFVCLSIRYILCKYLFISLKSINAKIEICMTGSGIMLDAQTCAEHDIQKKKINEEACSL